MSTISGTGTLYIREDSGSIQYSNDNSTWTTISAWPATIVNNDTNTTLVVLFTRDITLTASNQYFICGSSDIQFGSTSLNIDGTRPTITISGVTDYPGLIENGNINNGKNNITIVNLVVDGTTSILISSAGWIAISGFSKNAVNNKIINCSSIGDITTYSGGICGSAGRNCNLTIIGCTSSGNIGQIAGGIIGGTSPDSILIIEQCTSSGQMDIGGECGGILGGLGRDCSSIIIRNCYNTSPIITFASGGICGQYLCETSGSCIIENCYSVGNIAQNAGGIVGGNGLNTSIINCYSTGNITSMDSGGIVGYATLSTTFAYNCYTTGFSANIDASGGIFARSSNDNLQGTNNYSEASNGNSGIWTTNNANIALTGIPTPGPIGTSWITVVPNQPYNLRNIGFSPYSINNIITSGLTLNPSFSQTIQAGDSTVTAILPAGYTYTIIGINNQYPITYPFITINVATGEITTAPEITPGLYEIVVRNEINPYSVTIFYLTIPGGGGEPIITNVVMISPCCEIKQCIRDSPTTDKSNEVLTTTLTGKTIIGNVDRYYSAIQNGTRTFFAEPVFKSYREYMIYLQSKN
jgi:hypothetical protein